MADINQLGGELDEVERVFHRADDAGLTMVDGMSDICHRLSIAMHAYFGAIRRPLLARVRKLKGNSELPVSLTMWCDSVDAHVAAKQRLDQMDAAGRDFYSAREHCDASAAEEYTELVAEFYRHRRCEQRRVGLLVRAARKERRPIKRVRSSPTGYVKTGKYETRPDGVRVAIMRKQS